MAAPTIGRRPRFAPGPHAKIDWSHPLAQGCVAYTLPAYALDLAGKPVVVTGTVLRSTASPFGLGASGWAGANVAHETIGVDGVPIVGDVAQAAITGVFHGLTTGGGSGQAIYAERGSANPIANITYGTGTANKFQMLWRDNAGTLVNSASTASLNDGLAHVVSLVRTSTTTFELWIDGKLDLSVTSGSMTTTFSGGTLPHRIGTDSVDTSGGFPGTIVAVILHRNRSLSPNAVAQLHADPFAMLRG